ncbi:MAG TPA: DNA-3-methyladenine glycosylase 2 family protein, partial [Burkholderiales bacterium]|nr:DNA-3-methyladenine glycosylase 2 family protein [Burkholderiales bacterium]
MKPEYWDRAKRALAKKDPVMAAIIKRHPKVFMVRRGEAFMTLARAICGQQISVKAAQSVWNRVCDCVGDITPDNVLRRKRPQLRACGLSDRKTEYIADLAQHFVDGKIHEERWPEMDDEAIIAELTDVRGIGRWTAEMFLMFSLLRPDVFPLDDLGLQKGIRVAYFRNRKVALSTMRKLGE